MSESARPSGDARPGVPPDASPWTPPPRPTKPDGTTRRVGVELEFAGVSVEAAAEAVRETMGGEARFDTAHHGEITGARFGEFEVEVDTRYAKQAIESERLSAVRDRLVDLATAVIPVEVVCPPIDWDDCHVLDALVAALKRRGAEGTREGLLYAFGVQLNIEPPDEEVATLVATLQAFCLLRDWLREEIAVDPTRRLGFFESPYPSSFCARILKPDYAPDAARLIDDYLAFNPARDRELDLLPMLCMLDEARVRKRLPEEKINRRMTWHYRLPNAEFSDSRWSVGTEWARWVKVERLAEDHGLRRRLAAEWIENHERVFPADWTPRSVEIASEL